MRGGIKWEKRTDAQQVVKPHKVVTERKLSVLHRKLPVSITAMGNKLSS